MDIDIWKTSVRNGWKQNLCEEILSFQRENLLTDLTFICCDGRVEAHRLVLGSFSNLLHQLLLSGEESYGVISLPELSVKQLQCFVRAVYQGCLPGDQLELINAIIVFKLLVNAASLKSTMPPSSLNIDLDISLNKVETRVVDMEAMEETLTSTENIEEPRLPSKPR